jgi:hypothetical protein
VVDANNDVSYRTVAFIMLMVEGGTSPQIIYSD